MLVLGVVLLCELLLVSELLASGVVLWVVEFGVVVVVVVLVVEVLDCGIVVADGLALVPTCPDEVVVDPVL